MATACSKWERIGQPAVVSETTTSTRPLVLDLDRAHHAQLDDRAAQLGVDHGAQLLGDLILRRKRHRGHSRKAPLGGGAPAAGGRDRGRCALASECRRAKEGACRGRAGGRGRIVAMGVGLALALLLLVAGEAQGRQVRGRPVRLARRRRRRLGRHDRRGQVPPRLLLRDSRRRRPLRRRPPEELHPRRAADGLRHPLRPLALDGAAGDRRSPRSAGPGGTPSTTASSSGIGVDGRAAASTPSRRPPTTDVTPRDFVAGFSRRVPALEDRLLCARAESKWCSLEPGSWSALRALTITLEDDAAPGRGRSAANSPPAAGAAAPRASAGLAAPTPAAGSASAKPARRRPGRA